MHRQQVNWHQKKAEEIGVYSFDASATRVVRGASFVRGPLVPPIFVCYRRKKVHPRGRNEKVELWRMVEWIRRESVVEFDES